MISFLHKRTLGNNTRYTVYYSEGKYLINRNSQPRLTIEYFPNSRTGSLYSCEDGPLDNDKINTEIKKAVAFGRQHVQQERHE